MPLTAIDEPGTVDAFGVRFTMEERGRPVRCHGFRAAIDATSERASGNNEVLLDRFERSRALFERLASNLYDAGHRNPWIEGFIVTE